MKEIKYVEINDGIPTPLTVINYLAAAGHPLVNTAGHMIDYKPWGNSIGMVSDISTDRHIVHVKTDANSKRVRIALTVER